MCYSDLCWLVSMELLQSDIKQIPVRGWSKSRWLANNLTLYYNTLGCPFIFRATSVAKELT